MRRIVLLVLGRSLILTAVLTALGSLGGGPIQAHEADCRRGDARLRSDAREPCN